MNKTFWISVAGYFFATAAKFKIEPVADFVLFGTAFQFLQFLLVGMVLGIIHYRFGAR